MPFFLGNDCFCWSKTGEANARTKYVAVGRTGDPKRKMSTCYKPSARWDQQVDLCTVQREAYFTLFEIISLIRGLL